MLSFGKKIFIAALFVGSVLCSASAASAQNVSQPQSAAANQNLKPCPDGRGSCTLIPNPIQSRGLNIVTQVGGVVGYVLLLIGSLTLLMIVWGGFQWLTAAGNAEKIEQGSKTMLWAVLGVCAVFIAYFALNTYLDYLSGVK